MRPFALASLLVVMLLASGCVGGDEPAGGTPTPAMTTPPATTPMTPTPGSTEPIVRAFQGNGTGSTESPGVYNFTLSVPAGAEGVNASLSWGNRSSPIPSAARFDMELLRPDGTQASRGYQDVSGEVVVATIALPEPGDWTLQVRAKRASNTPFMVEATIDLVAPEERTTAGNFTIAPGGFFEIGMVFRENASFRFTSATSAPVEWNIHSHPTGEDYFWQTGNGTAPAGNFTAPSRGLFTVQWVNEGEEAVELDYEVVGQYRRLARLSGMGQ